MASSKTKDKRMVPPKNEQMVLPSTKITSVQHYYPQADNVMHDPTSNHNHDGAENHGRVPSQCRRRRTNDSRILKETTQPSSTTRRDKCGRHLSEDLAWWEHVIEDTPPSSCLLMAQDEAHHPMTLSSSTSSSYNSLNHSSSPPNEGDHEDYTHDDWLIVGEACEIIISTIRDHDDHDQYTREDYSVPNQITILPTRTTTRENAFKARQQYRRDLLKDDMGMFQEQLDFFRYCSKFPEASL